MDEGDPDAVAVSAAALGAYGSPLLAAEASAQCARIHARRGDATSVARSALRAELWRRQTAGAATPALDDVPRGLTAREVDVVEHAAGGLTSREIGDLLFVSVRTVDNHLHGAYRKLGVSGRAEAAGLVAATVPPGASGWTGERDRHGAGSGERTPGAALHGALLNSA